MLIFNFLTIYSFVLSLLCSLFGPCILSVLVPPNLSWGDSRLYTVLQRTLDKDCRQAEEPKQLVDEASQFHLGRQRQHSAVICSGALLLSSRVLRPSLVTLGSHKSCRCTVELNHWTPLLRLTSRKLLWLDLRPVDIKSRWRHNWKSAWVVNSHLICDPTIQRPGFDLPRQQWSLPNRFRTEQGHCGACRRKFQLTDTDLCPCVETQAMSHIVESCPLTKLNGGLFRLHSADEDAVSWLTSYGSWHAYEKERKKERQNKRNKDRTAW